MMMMLVPLQIPFTTVFHNHRYLWWSYAYTMVLNDVRVIQFLCYFTYNNNNDDDYDVNSNNENNDDDDDGDDDDLLISILL